MFALAVAMVVIAAWRPPESCPSGSVSVSNTNYSVIPITGKQLHRFITKDYVETAVCDADSDYLLKISAPADVLYPASPDSGPHFRLAPDIEASLSGNVLKLLIEARSLTAGTALELNYYTGPEGGSGWHRYELSSDFEQLVFDYEVPARQDQGVDFLAIRPVSASSQQDIEIRNVTFLTLSLMNAEQRRDAIAEHVQR